ncbi:MAG: hypothetical protein LBF38_09115 [Deltaproteobacteria bacterium]|nr:hypothetical protein [Deltaproteobacteria bacterium]
MKKNLKISIDLVLIALLVGQMPYVLVGEKIHEWLGALFFILVCVHVQLNRGAQKAIYRRFWSTPLRFLNCLIITLAGVFFFALIFSAPFISKYFFVFLPISGGAALARWVHLLSAYWGFIFFCLHLGLNLERGFGLARLASASPGASKTLTVSALIVTLLFVPVGLKAFITNDIPAYLFLRQQFPFFDFELPLWKVLAQSLAMVVTFAAPTFWLRRLLRPKKS